jgi:hypothetical protein
MAREEDCSEHRKIEREMAVEDVRIKFLIQSPFKGVIGKGHTTIGRVAP